MRNYIRLSFQKIRKFNKNYFQNPLKEFNEKEFDYKTTLTLNLAFSWLSYQRKKIR